MPGTLLIGKWICCLFKIGGALFGDRDATWGGGWGGGWAVIGRASQPKKSQVLEAGKPGLGSRLCSLAGMFA